MLYIWVKPNPIELQTIISTYSFLLGIVPVVFYVFFQKKINDKKLRVIVYLLLIGFTIDVFNARLNAERQPNFLSYNLFVLIETVLLYYFFSSILSLRFSKVTVYFFTACFMVVWTLFFRKFSTSNYVDAAVTFENITIIILSIIYFYEQINSPEPTIIYNQPRFWVVAAYLIYSAGTFFMFIYLDALKDADKEKSYEWNNAVSILKYLLITIAMFMKTDPPARKHFQLT
jgi:hypothetical protein